MFLVDVGNYLLNEIKKLHPKATVGSGEIDYGDALRVAILKEEQTEDVIAIYLDKSEIDVTVDNASSTALYFVPLQSSPAWVVVLGRYSPWPAALVPVAVQRGQAKVFSRTARPDELTAIAERLYANKNKIERELVDAGAAAPEIGNFEHAIGLSVTPDLGHDVLRRELGMDGKKSQPVWRPAFQATRQYAKECVGKITEYILTGKNQFALPENSDTVDSSIVKEGIEFARKMSKIL